VRAGCPRRYLKSLQELVSLLLDNVSSYLAVGCLLFIFICVFALMSLHTFGALALDITFPNFQDFPNAFIACFQVSCCCHTSLPPTQPPTLLTYSLRC